MAKSKDSWKDTDTEYSQGYNNSEGEESYSKSNDDKRESPRPSSKFFKDKDKRLEEKDRTYQEILEYKKKSQEKNDTSTYHIRTPISLLQGDIRKYKTVLQENLEENEFNFKLPHSLEETKGYYDHTDVLPEDICIPIQTEEVITTPPKNNTNWDIEQLEAYSDKVLDTVSRNVKKYREAKGFTQMQLALEIGLSGGAYLGRVEIRKPNHHFNIKHIAKISKVLDVPIEKFFQEDWKSRNFFNLSLSLNNFYNLFMSEKPNTFIEDVLQNFDEDEQASAREELQEFINIIASIIVDKVLEE